MASDPSADRSPVVPTRKGEGRETQLTEGIWGNSFTITAVFSVTLKHGHLSGVRTARQGYAFAKAGKSHPGGWKNGQSRVIINGYFTGNMKI